jgi:hypothetical protein
MQPSSVGRILIVVGRRVAAAPRLRCGVDGE